MGRTALRFHLTISTLTGYYQVFTAVRKERLASEDLKLQALVGRGERLWLNQRSLRNGSQ